MNATTTASQTFIDALGFHEDPPAFSPEHVVEYRCIVKTSGGTVLASAWSDPVTYLGVVDCP